MYLFLKIACECKSLMLLFRQGFFNSIDLNEIELSKSTREYLFQNPIAAALFVYARLTNDKGEQVSEKLEKQIKFARKIADWEFVKENVYPILVSTKNNEQILKHLVSTTFLDLSICYIIRNNLEEECGSNTKITTSMLECYGVNKKQLHNQALENLNKDGYEFLNMMKFIKNLPLPIFREEEFAEDIDMYVLTNRCQLYGAAGILNEQLLKSFAQDQDFFILPSSVHECIFVPVSLS